MSESDSMGKGPGSSAVPVWGVVISLLWLVFMSILCLTALAEIWPHPTPTGALPVTDTATAPKASSGTTGPTGATGVTGTTGATGATGLSGSTGSSGTTGHSGATGTTGASAVSGTTGTSSTTADVAQLCGTPEYQQECDCLQRADAVRHIYYGKDDKTPQSKNDPACVYIWLPFPVSALGFNGWHLLWNETRLLLIVMICGFLGALIYALRSLFVYLGHRSLLWSWLPMYIVIPIVGSMMAVVFYLVLRGGLFSSNTTVADTSPFGFAGIAALVSMFIQQTAEKLKAVFETLMAKFDSPKESVTTQKPQVPTVTKVTATAGSADIKVEGDYFTDAAKVLNNGVAAVTTKKSTDAKTLTGTFAVAPKSGDKLSITVADTAGTSKPVEVTVT